MVARAADWPWSSFRYTAGMDSTPTFLTLSDVWQMFDPDGVKSPANRSRPPEHLNSWKLEDMMGARGRARLHAARRIPTATSLCPDGYPV
jgi:hypothetical protein